jgi:hypothetical protein
VSRWVRPLFAAIVVASKLDSVRAHDHATDWNVAVDGGSVGLAERFEHPVLVARRTAFIGDLWHARRL